MNCIKCNGNGTTIDIKGNKFVEIVCDNCNGKKVIEIDGKCV